MSTGSLSCYCGDAFPKARCICPNETKMMTEEQPRMATGLLAHYHCIRKVAPRNLVIEAFSACLAAGVRPNIEIDPGPDSPNGGSQMWAAA